MTRPGRERINLAPRLRLALLPGPPPMERLPGRRGGLLVKAPASRNPMPGFNFVIMHILEIAGAVLLLALGVLWLALLLRIRLKLSAIEKELARPRKDAPAR